MSFQVIKRDDGTILAVFTGGLEYRRMLWLFPKNEYTMINFNGYPAVKLLSWNSESVFDAMLHG